MTTLVAAPMLLDLLGPAQGGPAGVGTAPGGTFVWMYATADCTGPVIEGEWLGRDGHWTIGFSAPALDTAYSAKAMSWTGEESACSSSLTYHVIHDECPVTPNDRPVTRPSRSSITTAGDYMPRFVFGDPDETGSLEQLMTGLKVQEPELMWIGGFGLLHHMHNGAVAGYDTQLADGTPTGSRVVGNWSPPSAGQSFKSGRLTPAELLDRKGYLEDYLASLAPHTRAGIYMDFGTQVYSNAERTEGLWDFYAHWDDYTADFDLGLKPPPVDEWLRRTWDPNYLWPSDPAPNGCKVPPEYVGLAPDYCPTRSDGSIRYAMNPLSRGFYMYWSLVLRTMAESGYRMAFIDNAYMHRCWNEECENGYDAWIAGRFTQDEIDRYLTQTVSRITHHASFDLWNRDANGVWSNGNNALTVVKDAGSTIAPDVDAVRGRYSLRSTMLDSTGAVGIAIYLDGPGGQWKLDMLTKTDCPAPTAYMEVYGWTPGGKQGVWTQTVPLPASPTWTGHSIPFTVPPEAIVPPEIRINLHGNTAGCSIWLDDLVGLLDGEEVTHEVRLHRQIDDAALHLRRTETRDYWDSIVDDRLPLLKQAALAVDPDFWLFTNSFRQRRGAEAFAVERALLESESTMIDRGTYPGTYVVTDPACAPIDACHPAAAGSCSCVSGVPIQQTTTADNILDYRVAAAYDLPDEFAYHVHNATRLDGYYRHDTKSATLALAEAAAFSGGALPDLQLDSEYYKYWSAAAPTLGDELRAHHVQFVDWSEANAELYSCLVSASTVGVVMRDKDELFDNALEVRQIELTAALDDAGITYDVIAEPGLVAENIARYRAIVYEGVPRVDTDEVAMLVDYMNAGGIVFASGDAGLYDEYFRRWDAYPASPAPAWPPVALASGQTVYPVGAGAFVRVPGGLAAADVVAQLPDAVAFPSLAPAQRATTRAAFWSAPNRVVAHVLDYATPIDRVDADLPYAPLVDLEVAIPTPDFTPTSAEVYSPDPAAFQGPVSFSTTGDVTTVILPSVDVYAVVVLRP